MTRLGVPSTPAALTALHVRFDPVEDLDLKEQV